jgi:outer membrane protein TolC
MLLNNISKFTLFLAMLSTLLGCAARSKLGPSLVQIEQRLEEETKTDPCEPNSLTYQRAVGELPARTVSAREMKAERILTLDECLQLAFANSNEIEEARQQMFFVGGSKLITNSRFLPTVELIYQYEHFRNFGSANLVDVASTLFGQISQTILEYGKDNPLDILLRAEQRAALFNYESQAATVFSQVRRAFFFIKLKEQQIATRQQLLEGFEKQYERKQRRMEEGNLSVKMEVLTSRLNVLEEESRINNLTRQKLTRKMELLRLIGLPVGAEQVEFEGQMDSFGLDSFYMDKMVALALAQSSTVASAQADVAEQQRALEQLRYEYIPDLRLTAGYQNDDRWKPRNIKMGSDVTNTDDTWALDAVGQSQTFDKDKGQTLGLFGTGTTLSGPDPGRFTGIQLRMPIFEGNARKGRHIQAKANLRSLEAILANQKDLVELSVRQSYKFLMEQRFQVELAQENVNIEKERFSINEQLKTLGKITDDQLETFRGQFFSAQDSLFQQQELLVERQEDLRLAVRYFK